MDDARRGRLFVLSGPSGVGKGTVVRKLRVELPELWCSVSATTRAARPGEREGEHYFFLSAARFAELIAGGELLEWADFAGSRYGTPRAPVEQRLAAGQDVLLEIDLQGARQVRRSVLGAAAVLVFLAPPSMAELARRLAGRGTESDASAGARMAAAPAELAARSEFDHTVVNSDVGSATRALVELVAGLPSPPG